MRRNYDFGNARRNPYAKALKKRVAIRLDQETLQYFQDLAAEVSLPYQDLMNSYLRQCAAARLRPNWMSGTGGAASGRTSAARSTSRKRRRG